MKIRNIKFEMCHVDYKLSRLQKKPKYKINMPKSTTEALSHFCEHHRLSKLKTKKMDRKRNNNGRNGRSYFRKSSHGWHSAAKDDNNNEPLFENLEDPNCICSRPPMAYECGRCHHYFHGRVAKICPTHPSDIFLMDFQRCPFCAAPTEVIEKAKLTWEQIRKFEEAELPGGDEGL